MNHIDYLEFPAKSANDVARAKEFYHGVFGWEYKEWGSDYIDTHGSGIGTGITSDASGRPAAPLAVVHVADLKAVHASVIASGGNITREIFSFPGGRRFHFIDPAGNELAAWTEA